MNKDLIKLAIDALENTKKLEHLVDRELREKALKELNKALKVPEEVKEPFAWKSTTPVYTPYVTDSRYRKFSKAVQKWYAPI